MAWSRDIAILWDGSCCCCCCSDCGCACVADMYADFTACGVCCAAWAVMVKVVQDSLVQSFLTRHRVALQMRLRMAGCKAVCEAHSVLRSVGVWLTCMRWHGTHAILKALRNSGCAYVLCAAQSLSAAS
jgi:hypothetical protein